MKEKIRRFFKDETGATAVEYAIIASLIAAVIAAAVGSLGGTTAALFQKASSGW
jgi:pilus assembly protein Flp/PilA